jgi:hypothetical protein
VPSSSVFPSHRIHQHPKGLQYWAYWIDPALILVVRAQPLAWSFLSSFVSYLSKSCHLVLGMINTRLTVEVSLYHYWGKGSTSHILPLLSSGGESISSTICVADYFSQTSRESLSHSRYRNGFCASTCTFSYARMWTTLPGQIANFSLLEIQSR